MNSGPHIVRKRLSTGLVWYVYAWRGGPQVHKSPGPQRPTLTPEIIRAVARAYDAEPAKDETTFRSLIRQWRSMDPNRPSSPEWEGLSDNTKRVWGSALNAIEDKWGEAPLAVFNDPLMKSKVFQWRDSRRSTPRAADIGVTVLRALLKFGVQRGRLSINVAHDIPNLYRNGARAEIIWTAKDLESFAAEAHQTVNDIVRLACETGLRAADLADLRWSEVGPQAIILMAAKESKGKRRKAMIPVTPSLQSLLDELRGRSRRADVDTVLVTRTGRPWSSVALSQRVGEVVKKTQIVHTDGRRKHLHDCRGTFATYLMLAGATDDEIARTLAWEPARVANIRLAYVDQARTIVALGERLTAAAVNRPVN